MGIRISDSLSEPFSERGDSLGANFSPSVIGIGSRAYLMDTESGEYKRGGVEVLQQRNTTNNRDLLLLPQDVWRYMFESWHQGAGQSNLDRDEALHYRFNESYGINVWDRYHFSLLNSTRQIHYSPTLYPGFLRVHNDYLVIITENVYTWKSPGSKAADIENTIGSSPVIDTAYDGDWIYSLHEDGEIHRSSSPHTSEQFTVTYPANTPNLPVTFITYAKDYLIIGRGNQLWNITPAAGAATATAVLVYTSPVTGFTWTDSVAGDRAIYLTGFAGDSSVVHSVQVSDDGTHLMPPLVAATLPDGEIGVSVGSYLGFVFIGTRTGVRMAVAGGDAALTLGAVIPVDSPVYGFEGQDRFVWFTNSHVPSDFGQDQAGFDRKSVPGLTRLDLTTFTVTEATPAYASDLVAEGDYRDPVVRDVVTWQGLRVFSIDNVGVFIENPKALMPAGWITHGTVSFGVEDYKTGLYAQFKWLPLEGGDIECYAAYDSHRYDLLDSFALKQSISSGNVPFNGQQFSRIDIGVVLRRDKVDFTKGPVVTRWEFRAVPVRGVASRWYLPILNNDTIELNGVVQHRDVREELRTLLGLVEQGGMVNLQEGGVSYQVQPYNFEWRPDKLSARGHAWQGVFILMVREIR